MSVTPLTDSTFQSVVNDWISNPGAPQFSDSSNSPYYGPISEWDVSQVTNMSNAFKNQATFNDDISAWNTSNVTNMSGLFYNATIFNQDISGWVTSSVTDMSYMFYNTQAMFNDWWPPSNPPTVWGGGTKSPLISKWDVSNVTNMSYMFYNSGYAASSMVNTSPSWVPPYQALGEQTYKSSNGQQINHPGWDVSKVTDMSYMFAEIYFCDPSIFNWRVQSNTILTNMFINTGGCGIATQNTPTYNNFNKNYLTSNSNVCYPPCPPRQIKDSQGIAITTYQGGADDTSYLKNKNKRPKWTSQAKISSVMFPLK